MARRQGSAVRGGVFIGVNRVGGLKTLGGAASDAERMHGWALNPEHGGMEPEHAVLFTDAGPNDAGVDIVKTDHVYEAVQKLTRSGVEHLFLYFSGHGLFANRNETWLLSEASERGDAGISVTKCAQYAQGGGIPHVVIISDACRTPAQTVEDQFIEGVSTFPIPRPNVKRRVEVFYATSLGHAAGDLKKSKEGLYTSVLYRALMGEIPAVLNSSSRSSGKFRYVHAKKLDKYLAEAIPKLIVEMGLEMDIDQQPIAEIPGGPGRWLARTARSESKPKPTIDYESDAISFDARLEDAFIADAIVTPSGAHSGSRDPIVDYAVRERRLSELLDRPRPRVKPISPNLDQVAHNLVRSMTDDLIPFGTAVELASIAPARGSSQLAASARDLAKPFGRRSTISAGVKVRGTRLQSPMGRSVTRVGAYFVECAPGPGAPENVLIVFDDGSGTVIPILPQSIAEVTVSNGQVISVEYEPAPDADVVTISTSAGLRELRAATASAALHSRVRLDGIDPATFLRKTQTQAGVDPSMAIYGAYAYNDVGQHRNVAKISQTLGYGFPGTPYDVALLSGQLSIQRGPESTETPTVWPFGPMLSRGWELLDGYEVRNLKFLRELRRTIRESVWTLFDGSGVALVERRWLQRLTQS